MTARCVVACIWGIAALTAVTQFALLAWFRLGVQCVMVPGLIPFAFYRAGWTRGIRPSQVVPPMALAQVGLSVAGSFASAVSPWPLPTAAAFALGIAAAAFADTRHLVAQGRSKGHDGIDSA